MIRTDTGIVVVFSALAVAACTSPGQEGVPGVASRAAIRITDDLGRDVALEKSATRIAALAPCFVESLFAIGCGERVILRDTWSDHPAPGVNAVPKVDGVQISVRNVAGFSPDLVVLFADDGRNADAFERVGLPVAVMHPDTYDEVAADIVKLGALCGREAHAQGKAEEMLAVREEVARGIGRSPRPSVYVEIDAADPTRPWTAGPGSFVAELVELAGGRNAATGVTKPYVQISAEAIIRAAPDIVLVAHDGLAGKDAAAEILGRPGWSSLAAASAGRVIANIDGDLLSRPGPRLADGLRALAAALREKTPLDGGAP